MSIKDELPISFVEGEGFLELPSQKTIIRDVLQLYENEKHF